MFIGAFWSLTAPGPYSPTLYGVEHCEHCLKHLVFCSILEKSCFEQYEGVYMMTLLHFWGKPSL